jgi:dTDP-4-dehydrorhamnose reductase
MPPTPSILVVGRSGRVARALAEEAERLVLPVRTIGRPALDIGEPGTIARVLAERRPTAIINAAGLVTVDEAERNPTLAFAVNCDGAAHLAAAAAHADIPLLHLSSDYVFDGAKVEPYREDDPPTPLNAYGRSKAAGETAVLAAHPRAIVVRTSWVYGPHGTSFLTTMLRLARTQEIVRVVHDQHGTPTADRDFAQALLDIAVQLQGTTRRSGVYHVAGAGQTTWLGFAEAIFSAWARRGHRVPRIEPVSVADWPGARRPRYSCLDCSKAERDFGIKLPRWQESIEHCLDRLAAADGETR